MVDYNAYQRLFEYTIYNNEKIRTYEEELDIKSFNIRVTLVTSSILDKLLHPVRLVKTQSEFKRITLIEKEYRALRGSTLVEHFDEEDGDLEHDLYAAATHFKPDRMEEFIDKNPINKHAKVLKLQR